jgi:hypothetical protein
MKTIVYSLGYAFICLTAGCSSSKITSSWRTPDTVQTPINKIMVVGLIREADRTMREQLEEHMIADLKALGYTAVSHLKNTAPKPLTIWTKRRCWKN